MGQRKDLAFELICETFAFKYRCVYKCTHINLSSVLFLKCINNTS